MEVRIFFKTGKLEKVKNEVKETHLDILGLCETRLAGMVISHRMMIGSFIVEIKRVGEMV